MKKLLLLATLVLAVTAGPAGAATIQVAIKSGGFSPSYVTIHAGDTVTWLNVDRTNHQVVAGDSSFASGILKAGESFSHTFAAVAKVTYHDGLDRRQHGTVNAQALPIPDSVTLAIAQQYFHYGEQATLTGQVSTRRAGEAVTIWAQPYPQTSYEQVATVTTGDSGNWDFVTKPEILTSYEARFRAVTSPTVMVQVLPKITFAVGNGSFTAHVFATHDFRDRSLYVQQKSSLGQWVSLKRVYLDADSSAMFKLTLRTKVPHPLRVYMSVNQAGAGYLSSTSGTQTVVRRCAARLAAC